MSLFNSFSLMENPTLISWTSPLLFYEFIGGIFHFLFQFKIENSVTACSVSDLTLHCCLCPTERTLRLYMDLKGK